MNKLIVLVIGNIGTGKTTFIRNLNEREKRKIIINDDYHDVDAPDLSIDINNAILRNETVIIEGNYTSRLLRSQVIYPLRLFYQNITFICFDFGSGNNKSLTRRLKGNHSDKNKIIKVHKKYKEEYQTPELTEGFYRIIRCNN